MARFLYIFVPFIFLAYKIYIKLTTRFPPGPPPRPFVGNLHQIKPIWFRSFTEWSQQYGNIISVWLNSRLNVVVSSPELAREVLKENDRLLANRYTAGSCPVISGGGLKEGQGLIWADYGPHCAKIRMVCSMELFSPKRLEALRPVREDEVTSMIESIYKDCINPENGSSNSLLVKNYAESVIFNILTRLVFGKRFVNSDGVLDERGQEIKALVLAGSLNRNHNQQLGAVASFQEMAKQYICQLQRLLFPADSDHEKKLSATMQSRGRIEKITRAIMDEHEIGRREMTEEANKQQHFVEALLDIKDEYDLNEDTIISLLWDMMVAGLETTVASVEWAMAEMIKHPRIQKKAQQELDGVIGTSERLITEWDFSNLPYLRCIAKESIRLHPPLPLLLPHVASEHIKLAGGYYDVPRGSTVHVNVWALARDPRAWKDNASEFWPERFMEEDVDMKGHDFRLLPFGAGRRGCPAAQLGVNLVMSVLGHLLHGFNWMPADGLMCEEIDMEEGPGVVSFMRTELQGIPVPRLPTHLYKRVGEDV